MVLLASLIGVPGATHKRLLHALPESMNPFPVHVGVFAFGDVEATALASGVSLDVFGVGAALGAEGVASIYVSAFSRMYRMYGQE